MRCLYLSGDAEKTSNPNLLATQAHMRYGYYPWVMGNFNGSPEQRITEVAQRLFKERSIGQLLRSDDYFVDVGLNSLDLVKLVLRVEEEFDVELPTSEITPTNFRSIATISRLITRLLGDA
jgi:acyl carrier protein